MDLTKVKYSVSGSVALICLDSPKNLNAFDEVLIDEVVYALRCAKQDGEIRAVILSSSGKNFSAGGDIGSMYKGLKDGTLDFNTLISKMAAISLAIKQLPKPVIAAVSGAVAGASFNVALACDFCIAADNAQFIQAFVNVGLVPDGGGFYLLTRAVGVNKAAELAMTGRAVGAAEAKALGFVCEVCPPDELEQRAQQLAQRLAAGPSMSYAEMKRLIMVSDFRDFEDYIKEEVKSQVACAETEDFKEGVSAFVEKRKARFQ